MTALVTATLPTYDATLIDSARPPCEAAQHLFPVEDDCPDPAVWVLRMTGWDRELACLLVCDSHLSAAYRHVAVCRMCAGLDLSTEPL